MCCMLVHSGRELLIGNKSSGAPRKKFCMLQQHRPLVLPLFLLLLISAPTATKANAAPQYVGPSTSTTKKTTHTMTGAETQPTKQDTHDVRPRLSERVRDTEPAHIEAVLSRYVSVTPQPSNLAQGVAHWDPPPAALQQMTNAGIGGGRLTESSNHNYGPALGLPVLREALLGKLETENGLDMTGQEVSYWYDLYSYTDFVLF